MWTRSIYGASGTIHLGCMRVRSRSLRCSGPTLLLLLLLLLRVVASGLSDCQVIVNIARRNCLLATLADSLDGLECADARRALAARA